MAGVRKVVVVVAMVVVLSELVGAVGVVIVVLDRMGVPVRALVVAVVDAAVTRPGRAMLDSSTPSLDEAHAAATTDAATTSKGRHVRRTTSATVATDPQRALRYRIHHVRQAVARTIGHGAHHRRLDGLDLRQQARFAPPGVPLFDGHLP
ncbi:MAG: hypothetical protein WKF58_00900 [Ilumatobacteraceae bacterium]